MYKASIMNELEKRTVSDETDLDFLVYLATVVHLPIHILEKSSQRKQQRHSSSFVFLKLLVTAPHFSDIPHALY